MGVVHNQFYSLVSDHDRLLDSFFFGSSHFLTQSKGKEEEEENMPRTIDNKKAAQVANAQVFNKKESKVGIYSKSTLVAVQATSTSRKFSKK